GDTDHDTNEQSGYRCRDLGVMTCPKSLRKQRGQGGQHVQSAVRQPAMTREKIHNSLKHIRFSPVNGDAGCRSSAGARQRCKGQSELLFASAFIVEIGAFARAVFNRPAYTLAESGRFFLIASESEHVEAKELCLILSKFTGCSEPHLKKSTARFSILRRWRSGCHRMDLPARFTKWTRKSAAT